MPYSIDCQFVIDSLKPEDNYQGDIDCRLTTSAKEENYYFQTN